MKKDSENMESMKFKNKRKITGRIVGVLLALTLAQTANGGVLYQSNQTQTLTGGVTYNQSTRLYERGWVDVNAVIIDIKDPNVRLEVIGNQGEYGLKQNVETFAKQSGAVAAVNGDFFGGGDPKSSMGVVIKDGVLESTRNYFNGDRNAYAGIFVDTYDTPFVDYLKIIYIGYFGANTAKIQLDGKNKVSASITKPIYFDRKAAATTADLDKRTTSLSKIVVVGDTIAYISSPGEVVNVPEDGYVIVLDQKTASADLQYFHVGDKCGYTETYRFIGLPDKGMHEVKFGLSGGGKILENGQTVDTGLIIEKNGRPPRTLVGIDKERTKVILITVDGRGAGAGATHWECAEILREFGAWDGLHLDGGGSTTMVTASEGDTTVKLQNTPSDGAQRKVANALGVFTSNAPGPLSGFFLTVDGKKEDIKIMAKWSVALIAKGHDANFNPVDAGTVTYSNTGIEGTWSGNVFTPSTTGKGVLTATNGTATSSVEVTVVDAATALKLTPSGISLKNGDKVNIKARVVNDDGFGYDASPSAINWSIDPPIGLFDQAGTFTATATGQAVITASYAGITGKASVAIGTTASTVDGFETDSTLVLTPYPSGVTGGLSYVGDAKEGSRSVAMTYTFMANQESGQSASIDYKSAAQSPITGKPLGIGLWVKGDGSGYDIKMNIKDANGAVHNLDFKKPLTFTDWQYAYQQIPDGVTFPITLDKIYVIANKTAATKTNTIYVDDVRAEYAIAPERELAITGGVGDPMRVDLTGAKAAGDTVISVMGPTAFKNDALSKVVYTQALSKMAQGADGAVFAGYSDLSASLSIPMIKWKDLYELNGLGNIRTISLATSKGGLRANGAFQWTSLQNDLYNTEKKNTLIIMNADIWAGGFTDSKERDAFHDVVKTYHQSTGANVIVVAGAGYQTKVNNVDGVRYITLNGLLSQTYDLNNDYNILKIKATANEMFYDIQPIYQESSQQAAVEPTQPEPLFID